MATTWKAPTWRMPNEKNQSKFESYSLHFNGSSDYIDTNYTPPANWFNNGFSISALVYPTSPNNDTIIGAYSGGRFYWRLYDTNKWWVGFGSWHDATTVNSVTSDEWQHIVLTYTPSDTTIRFYRNGVADGSIVRDLSGAAMPGLPLAIGVTNQSSNNGYFDGSISDTTIFDYTLSESQVSSLYNSGSPINPMTLKPAPIAYYPLGGNASTGGDSSNTLSVPNIAVPDASVFEFAQSNSYPQTIDFGNPFSTSNKITFAIWFNSTTTIGGDTGYTILSRGSVSAVNGCFVLMVRNNNEFQCWFYDDSGTSPNPVLGSGTNFTNYNDGNWHHIAITIDGTLAQPALKMYLDGVLASSATSPNTGINQPAASVNQLLLGQRQYTYSTLGAKYSNLCTFDDVLELTGTQSITSLYNNGMPPDVSNYNNLTGWWELNQSANWEADSAGNWQIPDAVSSYPQSFDFSGGNYIDCGNDSSLSPSNFTLSVWAKSDLSNGSWISKYASENYGFGIYGGSIFLNIKTSAGWGGLSLTASSYLTANNWHHIVGTYDETDLKIYVDGNLAGTLAKAGPITYSSRNTRIGNLEGTSALDFNGQISNAQIFDTALPATGTNSIETLYNNGVPLTTAIATDNLKGWWKLSDNEIWDGTNWEVENQKYPAGFDSALKITATASGITTASPIISNSTTHSTSWWVKYDFYTTREDLILIGQGLNYYLMYVQNSGLMGFRPTTASALTLSPSSTYKAITNLNTGKWYNYVFIRDGGNIKLYENNVKVWDATMTAGTESTATDLIQGFANVQSYAGRTSNYSNFSFFDTAISESDVQTLYNNGTPLTDVSSLTAMNNWYKLDNLTSGLQDSVGSNNATATGTVAKINTFVSTEAGTSSGMTEQNLVNNNVSALNGESSGMDTSNLVTSTLTRQVPYNSYSFSFDGVNDYIETASHPIDFTTGNFTCSAWINVANDGNHQGIFGIRNSTSTALQFYVRNNNKLYSWNGSSDVISTSTIINDVWNHVVLIQDGSDKKFFINGVLDNTVAQGNGSTSTATFKIGFTGNGSEYLNGKVSNCAIFDEALTSTEVLKLYNSGVPSDLSSFNPNPISWWSLGSDSYYNGANYICPDLVGSNNGTSSGMDANALIGNAPNSTANGTSTNMAIDANLTGSAPNSSNNSFSVNMDYTDRETSVPS